MADNSADFFKYSRGYALYQQGLTDVGELGEYRTDPKTKERYPVHGSQADRKQNAIVRDTLLLAQSVGKDLSQTEYRWLQDQVESLHDLYLKAGLTEASYQHHLWQLPGEIQKQREANKDPHYTPSRDAKGNPVPRQTASSTTPNSPLPKPPVGLERKSKPSFDDLFRKYDESFETQTAADLSRLQARKTAGGTVPVAPSNKDSTPQSKLNADNLRNTDSATLPKIPVGVGDLPKASAENLFRREVEKRTASHSAHQGASEESPVASTDRSAQPMLSVASLIRPLIRFSRFFSRVGDDSIVAEERTTLPKIPRSAAAIQRPSMEDLFRMYDEKFEAQQASERGDKTGPVRPPGFDPTAWRPGQAPPVAPSGPLPPGFNPKKWHRDEAPPLPGEKTEVPVAKRRGGWLDQLQAGLDAIGIVEPTPFADGTNAVISGIRALTDPSRSGEHLRNAGISLASAFIPYAGDAAKLAKYGTKSTARGAGIARGIDSFTAMLTGQKPTIANAKRKKMKEELGSRGGSNGGGGNSVPPSDDPAPEGDPSGDGLANIIDSVASGFGRLAKQMGPLGWVVAGAAFGLSKFVEWMKKIDSTSERIIQKNRELAQFDGRMANAYAQFDAGRIQRQMERAHEMAAPMERLLGARSNLDESKRELFEPLEKVGTDILAGVTTLVSWTVQLVDYLEPISEVVAWWYDQEKKPGEANNVLEYMTAEAERLMKMRKL